jgi:hypothetical protein
MDKWLACNHQHTDCIDCIAAVVAAGQAGAIHRLYYTAAVGGAPEIAEFGWRMDSKGLCHEMLQLKDLDELLRS